MGLLEKEPSCSYKYIMRAFYVSNFILLYQSQAQSIREGGKNNF